MKDRIRKQSIVESYHEGVPSPKPLVGKGATFAHMARYFVKQPKGKFIEKNAEKLLKSAVKKTQRLGKRPKGLDESHDMPMPRMRTYRVKVERASEEQEEVPSFELRTIAAANLSDAKHRAVKRFGMKRVKNVAPARREQTMEAVEDWDDREFEDPATNICPDCEGRKFVEIPSGRSSDPYKKVRCERCDGAGEVFESVVKPTFIQFLVESMDEQRIRKALRHLDRKWERKPTTWRQIRNTFTREDLAQSRLQLADIPTYHLGDLFWEDSRNFPEPMDKFSMQKPKETIFFLRVPGEGTFLVNTEGSDYVRYALKAVSEQPQRNLNQFGVPPEWMSDKPQPSYWSEPRSGVVSKPKLK